MVGWGLNESILRVVSEVIGYDFFEGSLTPFLVTLFFQFGINRKGPVFTKIIRGGGAIFSEFFIFCFFSIFIGQLTSFNACALVSGYIKIDQIWSSL